MRLFTREYSLLTKPASVQPYIGDIDRDMAGRCVISLAVRKKKVHIYTFFQCKRSLYVGTRWDSVARFSREELSSGNYRRQVHHLVYGTQKTNPANGNKPSE